MQQVVLTTQQVININSLAARNPKVQTFLMQLSGDKILVTPQWQTGVRKPKTVTGKTEEI